LRPLFYRYPHGLRFELSEGSDALTQFLTAHRKAEAICEYIFYEAASFVICLKFFGKPTLLSSLSRFKQLASANIHIPQYREMWSEKIDTDDGESDSEYCFHSLVFELPTTLLKNVLWCALSSDFGSIQPNPGCLIYFFHLPKQVMVFPYDDRGMDVVGPNHAFLTKLYETFSEHLLAYDRGAMDATFKDL
jgi:hypothetical protein